MSHKRAQVDPDYFAAWRDRVDEGLFRARTETSKLLGEPIAGTCYVTDGMFAAECSLVKMLV